MDKEKDKVIRHERLVMRLLSRCESLDRKVSELEVKCADLREQLTMKEEMYNDVLTQYRIYKMSMSLNGVTRDNEEVKKYLAHMIKEIDTCKAMLNE